MSDQPEAKKVPLIEQLESVPKDSGLVITATTQEGLFSSSHYAVGRMSHEAAAELRRLHAENERLHQINQAHEMKLSVRGYELQIADLLILKAERDALLEALKKIKSHVDTTEYAYEIAKVALDAARSKA